MPDPAPQNAADRGDGHDADHNNQGAEHDADHNNQAEEHAADHNNQNDGHDAGGWPSVSVIIAARNAEATIGATLDSVLSQDYSGPMEVIVADGSDTPTTSDIIKRFHPSVRLIANPRKTVGYGLNEALHTASGDVVLRCDAHTTLGPGYAKRAVETLRRTNAGNVGGWQKAVGTTFFERAVALGMSTRLGVGGSRYRLGKGESAVDTAFLGAFRRAVLNDLGGYDASLTRNQDYELNYRLRKRGMTVWFDPELVAVYRPRSTLRALARQYFDYGRWKPVVLMKHPASARGRHFAAPLLVLALAVSLAAAAAGLLWLTAAIAAPYLGAVVIWSAAVGVQRRDAAAVLLPLVLVTMHLCWGVGFFMPARRRQAPHRNSAPQR